MINFIIFAISMMALIYGAGFIVKESERVALHFNIPHFIIGATLIALGTSLPEMAASMSASAQLKSDMAIANVLGSVIFNITMVLGIVFLVASKIRPKRDLFAKDSAWALFPILVFILMAYNGTIDRFEGILLLVLMAGYLLFLMLDAKELAAAIDKTIEREKFIWTKTIIFLLVGFSFVIGGAHYVVQSGSAIALNFGVSEWIIGLLLISLGTSLPELVVSIVAARKGNADMSIGNIIGSNVANFTMVLGAASLVNPLTTNIEANLYDLSVALIATVMLLFITANKLYNKSAGIALIIVLILFLNENISGL